MVTLLGLGWCLPSGALVTLLGSGWCLPSGALVTLLGSGWCLPSGALVTLLGSGWCLPMDADAADFACSGGRCLLPWFSVAQQQGAPTALSGARSVFV